ncbi:hypothetical protein CEV31_2696 [Brucella thiophenivorans]|uniref:Apiosidase-like catalytic domain-containing protein n=1 Tax=Brucella thiophenivorans TaxID=571255 RepID=A0A256FM37_9HYPH|nr:hypothetical protein CEV31_2696 [Brucella thiophenivorans]
MGVLLFTMGAAPLELASPIKVSWDHRFFEDAQGKPFLLQGDTAWSLIAELKREDTEIYLKDRSKRGFNAILVNLIEHQFSSNPPANAYGDKPFLKEAFGELNPRYFDHAAWVIEQAQKQGLVVFLAPAYLGVNGGNQGWFEQAEAAGPEKMRTYGEAVAHRFSKFSNIVWVLGGDFDPPDRELVIELSHGITSVSPSAIQTVHTGSNVSAGEIWSDQPWLGIDTVYTYDDVNEAVLQRTKLMKMPVILLESSYEYERDTTAQTIRRNAYGALLGGAAGQFFGNHPIWHFTGPGLFAIERSWQEALSSPGSQSMTILKDLFDKIAVQQLQPDRDNNISGVERSYAAALPDRSLILIYGDVGSFKLKPDVIASGQTVIWLDPASGMFSTASKPDVAQDLITYQPPDKRDDVMATDWLLLIGSDDQLRTIQKK